MKRSGGGKDPESKKQRTMESSSDDEVSVGEEEMSKIIELETQLRKNPQVYDVHMEYIGILRSVNLHEKLKKARREFHKRFPLSEKLWLEWIDDEKESEEVGNLLSLAVEDYLSINLWSKYLEFSRDAIFKGVETTESFNHWRETSETALELCGVHFSRGFEIWQLVITTEKKFLDLLADHSSEKEDQIELIRQLYFRALQIPLLQLDELLKAYGEWESSLGSMTTDPPPHIQSLLQSTRDSVEIRKKFENSISEEVDPVQLLADYVAYCQLEEKHGTVQQVSCVYERALFAFPVTHSLWIKYGTYVEKKTKDYQRIMKVYRRAVRNCPWLGQLWEKMIRSSALYEAPLEEVQAVYEQALQAGLKGEEDYIVVILSWLDYLRCYYWKEHKGVEESSSFSYDSLRNAFQFADSLIKSYFPKYVDLDYRILQYWTQCEISIAQDIDQARFLWETTMENGRVARDYKSWKLYIQMESSERHHGPARKLFNRAFQSVKDPASRYTLAQEWLRHEGMTGTPKQYASALNHVQSFMEEYMVSLMSKQNPQLAKATEKKTKQMPALSEAETTTLRRHRGKQDRSQSTGEAHLKPRRRFEKQRGEESKPKVFYDDKNTLFVTRIAPSTEDHQLKEVFEECGELSAIRHVRYPDGSSKGRAYVVFETEQSMQRGLEKNNTLLNGKKLLIQVSKPTRIYTPAEQKPPMQEEETKPLTNEDFRKMLR